MIAIRRGHHRGHFNHGWLDTYHTFSFAGYHDPRHMGFRSLRVINEDVVAPGHGFGMHPHQDMEIVTWVLDGALEHRDSLGGGAVLRPGEVQRITAGTGIQHSETNPSDQEPVHLLQIWLLPSERGLEPGYDQRPLPAPNGHLHTLIASPDGRDGSVTIHQDVDLWAVRLPAAGRVEHRLKPGRHAWVQVTRGAVRLDGESLSQGDGAAVSEQELLTLESDAAAEVLLFDLA